MSVLNLHMNAVLKTAIALAWHMPAYQQGSKQTPLYIQPNVVMFAAVMCV